MSNYLLGFPNKRERDDFLIALVAIAFFGWLMSRSLGCNKDNVLVPKEALTPVTAVVEDIVKDTDKDGIPDGKDTCPELAGVLENSGCPADTDGDGVYDINDKCPTEKGTDEGCPADKDGDGIADADDKCPELAGVEANEGCPADSDGDGVYDAADKCPGVKGLAANNGCPEIKVDEAEAEILRTAMQAVEFETGNAYLKRNSMKILKQIVGILNKYPKYKIDIIGHTDSVGDDESNLELSRARAASCYTYLVENGIKASRIKHLGKGERQPIKGTDPAASENRRVEFKLHY